MKTPTPQEQAEMLIEAFLFQDNYGIAENTGIPGIESEEIAIKAAIVTVEEIIKAQPLKNGTKKDGLKHWQEVLTILKGKL